MQRLECPICKSELVEIRLPEWDKELRIYAKRYFRCDICYADITIDHGVVTMTDKSGKIILSGK